jgi:hypothetical protein
MHFYAIVELMQDKIFRDLRRRFESKFIPEPFSGCWLWITGLFSTGYGQFYYIGEKNSHAHRVAWTLYRGEIPKGLQVLHLCDTRCCVNPDHLFLGTHTENMRDMVAKGRSLNQQGERNHGSKLRANEVIEIRKSKEKNVTLSKQFGVHQSLISKIKSRKCWKHV